MSGAIRVGIGGWTYKPWRGTFFPEGLRQADELRYAASKFGAIEISGTYYRLQKPESFAKWRDAAPDGFRYTIKASRFCTNRRVLAEAEQGIANFFKQGIEELGDRLGPILWQFMPTKTFDPDDFEPFLAMLPVDCGGLPLHHVLEVRHESFLCEEFVAMARRYEAGIVVAHHVSYPQIADLSGDIVYVRLQCARKEIATGYEAKELAFWAGAAKTWAKGGAPDGLEYAAPDQAVGTAREVYLFMINGAKIRAPAAAEALTNLL